MRFRVVLGWWVLGVVWQTIDVHDETRQPGNAMTRAEVFSSFLLVFRVYFLSFIFFFFFLCFFPPRLMARSVLG